MGYTTYWDLRKGKNKDLSGCLKWIRIILDKYGTILQFENDEPKELIATKNLIRFNGIGDDGHETFYFEYPPKESKYKSFERDGFLFSFCKTASKPYDRVVCLCLLILKAYLGSDMQLSSDGSIDTIETCDEGEGYWFEAKEELKELAKNDKELRNLLFLGELK